MSVGGVSNQASQAAAHQRLQNAPSPISHGHRRHPDASQGVSWTQAQNQSQGQNVAKPGANGIPNAAIEPSTATKVGQVMANSASGKIFNITV
ncbi:MAG TPA: hypothetical protein VN802_24035 [Stellaceae bacterium]|nr:hypothetical protein [Stellaceae bacterium]